MARCPAYQGHGIGCGLPFDADRPAGTKIQSDRKADVGAQVAKRRVEGSCRKDDQVVWLGEEWDAARHFMKSDGLFLSFPREGGATCVEGVPFRPRPAQLV